MKANRQPRSKVDLSTLGTMLKPKAVAPLDEAEEAIAEIMATLEPFQQQILVHKLQRMYQ